MQASFANKLITRFSKDDFAHLGPHLERVEMKFRDLPVQSGRPISHVYFPGCGQCSILVKVPNSEPIEVGIFGREGMSDMVPDFRTPFDTIVQVAGYAHRIEAARFTDAVLESRALSDLTARYHRAMQTQLGFTALAHGSFTVTERLARWILMVHDRSESDELALVHDFFSWMLAVRRAGVTEALKELRSHDAIDARRGHITVLDRATLIELASGCYGPAEVEYERLMGVSPRSRS